MKKTMLHLLRISVFCLILAVLLWGLSGLMERKESREKIEPFLACANDVDVLFLGSSHMLSAVYPMELWRDYGITGYNLGSYNNTVPVSYWMLRCALDVCTPEMVVLDVDGIGHDRKLGGGSADVHTALDGFPLNATKLRAIDDLMSDPEEMDDFGNRYCDLRREYVFPLMLYHGRWTGLTKNDFRPELNRQLGAYMSLNVAEPAEYCIVADAADETEPGFSYLRRLIDECGSRGIDVLLINAPYPAANGDEQRFSNAVYYTAQECGVEYVDFVYMDQIVDYGTDCYDPASHLNSSGARKVTDYLGAYMRDVYGLEDHRGDPAYADWQRNYDAYVERKIQMLREQSDLRTFLMMLHDPDFSACVFVPEGSALYEDERIMRLLQNIGRRHLYEEDTYESVWADGLTPLAELEAAAAEGAPYLCVIDRGAAKIGEARGAQDAIIDATFGRLHYSAGDSGSRLTLGEHAACFEAAQEAPAVWAVVIDERTDGVAMVRRFDSL